MRVSYFIWLLYRNRFLHKAIFMKRKIPKKFDFLCSGKNLSNKLITRLIITQYWFWVVSKKHDFLSTFYLYGFSIFFIFFNQIIVTIQLIYASALINQAFSKQWFKLILVACLTKSKIFFKEIFSFKY